MLDWGSVSDLFCNFLKPTNPPFLSTFLSPPLQTRADKLTSASITQRGNAQQSTYLWPHSEHPSWTAKDGPSRLSVPDTWRRALPPADMSQCCRPRNCWKNKTAAAATKSLCLHTSRQQQKTERMKHFTHQWVCSCHANETHTHELVQIFVVTAVLDASVRPEDRNASDRRHVSSPGRRLLVLFWTKKWE